MSPIVATAALAIGLGAHLELLARLRAAEPGKPWWFGYARDGANLAVTFMLWGAYLLIGFQPATALLAGLLTTLATYLLDWTFARALKISWARTALAIPLAAWVVFVAVAPGIVLRIFERLLRFGAVS
jgi:hypothetical protein